MKLPLNFQELRDDLKAKKYSAVDLVDRYLSQISKHNRELNAYITIIDNQAYESAKQADRIIADNKKAFEEFPLLGVVFSVKDLYSTKGARTTAGSKLLDDYVPQYSSTVVERLEKAGAIIIGKTNCDAWAHGGSGENSDYGPTKNPWDKTRVPGGSSSGSAVSVAAGMSMSSMGTDTGGSIRLPASFTNTVGFKPTYGAVSRYGVIAMASSLDSMGHFTRTVADSREIFSVTKGKDRKDSTLVESKHSEKSKIIGIPKEYMQGLDKEVQDKIESVRRVFEELGYEFKEVSLPHLKYSVASYYIIQPAEVSSNLNRYDGVRFGAGRSMFSTEAKRRIMLGTYVLSSGYYDAYYLKAMKVRTKIREDFENVFKEVGVLFSPVSPDPPFKLGERMDDPLKMYLSDVFTVSANLAGIPAISIPAGFTNSGLPIGFQLMGSQFEEDLLFDSGEKYQSRTDWHNMQPDI